MINTKVETTKIVIKPNQITHQRYEGGVQLACLEATSNFEVSFDGGSSWTILGRGIEYNQRFDELRFRSSESVPIMATIIRSTNSNVFKDRRNFGETSFTGEVGVVGHPLTTRGGSVSPLGRSRARFTIDRSTETKVIDGAMNTNGIILHYFRIYMPLVRTSYVYSTLGYHYFWDSQQGNGNNGYFDSPRPLYLEPGDGIAARQAVDGNVLFINIGFEVL